MRKFFSLFLLFILLISCQPKNKNSIDVSKVKADFKMSRFDIDFYTANKNTLEKIKTTYPLFFPKNIPDSVWVHKMNDKDEQELFAETQKIYSDITFLKTALEQLFKHIKYYNTAFQIPNVVTLLSNVDYESKVIYTKNKVLISLDVYLGTSHHFYADFPNYIKQNYHKNHIVVDVANAILKANSKIVTNRTFISKMVEEGKLLYMLDKYLPEINDAEKIGYSTEKLKWAEENEQQIWKYFIANKLLFSTDTKLNKRFLEAAPFSKFYRSEDNLSPGRIGAWLGWQIVRSYMKHNDVSLQKLKELSAEEIYKKSKYKPKK